MAVGLYDVLFAPYNKAVTIKLLRYTLVMFTFPVGVFYLVYHLILGGKRELAGWAGIAAVIAANVVIAFYVWMAYTEEDDDKMKTTTRNNNKTD